MHLSLPTPAPKKNVAPPSSDVRWANGLSITPHSTVTQWRHFVISVITFIAIFKVHLRNGNKNKNTGNLPS